jgi:hypothetical protein
MPPCTLVGKHANNTAEATSSSVARGTGPEAMQHWTAMLSGSRTLQAMFKHDLQALFSN